MNEQKQAELTLGERRYLERVREAQSEGVSLKEYYLAHGLSLRMLSSVQRQLSDKGGLCGRRAAWWRKPASSSKCASVTL
jgi:hypothetical protein